jgi:hypothetical protein
LVLACLLQGSAIMPGDIGTGMVLKQELHYV